MPGLTRIRQAFTMLIIAAGVGLAGGWGFAKSMAGLENLALADASEKLEAAALKVVWLSAGDAPEINDMAQSSNVVTLRNADLVKKLDAGLPLDVLVFDAALKNKLDQQWIQRRYRQGMAVSGINVSIKELAELVGDNAAIVGPWQKATPPQDERFFSLLQLFVSGDDPKEVAHYLREEQFLVNEDGSYRPVDGVKSPLSVSRTKAQVALSDPDALNDLFHQISVSVTDPTP